MEGARPHPEDPPSSPGENEREFVLSYEAEAKYLEACSDTLKHLAVLMLDTGLRLREAVELEWSRVSLEPATDSRFGYVDIRDGKSKNARRTLSISPRLRDILILRRRFFQKERWVFPGRRKGQHLTKWGADNLHRDVRSDLGYGKEFVLHSLRHTFGTRLGESGADAFTIMRLMGHSSVTVSQKYVHKTPESLERAFARLDEMNQIMRGEEEAGRRLGLATNPATVEKDEP